MSFNESSSNDSSTTATPSEPVPNRWYFVAVVIVLICLLGIPANILVITKLSRHLRGSTISQRLFFNLAVSDLLCLLCLPPGMVILFSGSGASLPYSVCQLLLYFFFFCVSSDLNILVLIGIQRYYQILHPQKWGRLARNWQRLLLSSVWMFAALEALPVVFSLMATKKERTVGHSCGGHFITPVFEAVYIGLMILSHLVLLTCYVFLVGGVSRAKMAKRKQPRATKIFIRIIAVSLAVAFFPFILRMVYVVALFTERRDLLHISQALTFVECFYFFNHCLNPFLYFFSSQSHSKDSNKRNTVLSD